MIKELTGFNEVMIPRSLVLPIPLYVVPKQKIDKVVRSQSADHLETVLSYCMRSSSS